MNNHLYDKPYRPVLDLKNVYAQTLVYLTNYFPADALEIFTSN